MVWLAASPLGVPNGLSQSLFGCHQLRHTLLPAMRQQAQDLLGFDDGDLIDCTPILPTIH